MQKHLSKHCIRNQFKGLVVSKEEIAKRLTGQSDVLFYNFDVIYAHIKNLKKKLL